MEENLNNKEFVRFVKTKFTQEIEAIFSITYESQAFETKKNEINAFLFSLINDKYISNTNKISFYFLFLEIVNNYRKAWVVEFLTQVVMKIKTINDSEDFLLQSDYFLFKILSEKENIKNLINIYIELISISTIMVKVIYSFPESRSVFNEEGKVMSFIAQTDKEIKELFEINENEKTKNNYLFLKEFEKTLKIIVNFYEDKYINIINNKYFFEKNEDGIFITESFKKFIFIILGLKTENISFINSNEYENVKSQFDSILLNPNPFT